MAWKLKLHNQQPTLPQVGDMWFCRKCFNENYRQYYLDVLSERYFHEWSQSRPPLYVLLPDGTEFCLDGKAACDNTGWVVRGFPNEIHLTPSINIRGGYHGFIRNGILTDDCEGRKFNKRSVNEILIS